MNAFPCSWPPPWRGTEFLGSERRREEQQILSSLPRSGLELSQAEVEFLGSICPYFPSVLMVLMRQGNGRGDTIVSFACPEEVGRIVMTTCGQVCLGKKEKHGSDASSHPSQLPDLVLSLRHLSCSESFIESRS